MEPWQKETSRYDDRLAQVGRWRPDLSSLVQRLPSVPLNYSPSPEGLVALQLALFVLLGCLASADESVAAFLHLWRGGLFTTISLPARFIFELWGGAHFGLETIVRMHESGQVDTASGRSHRLLTGARSEVVLPWGRVADAKAIHIMDFVRTLDDIYPQARSTYGFLCESCHPSFTMLSYWSLAGPRAQNWTNERFRDHAHNLLTRTLEAVERALEGIAVDTTRTLQLSLPYIEADVSRDSAQRMT